MDKQFEDFVIYDNQGNEKKNIYGKRMYSSESKVDNTKASDLDLETALVIVSYPKYILEYIKQFIIDNYSNNDLAKVYMVSENGENIFVTEYSLTIELNGKNYRIYVLVYFPILFPNYPPEFYIEKTNSVCVNNKYLDGKINPNDLKINIDYFGKFDANKNNVSEIIDNLVASFNQDFPVYKGSNNADNVNSSGRCVFDKFKANLIILTKNPKSYSSNNISSIRPEQKNGFKNINLDVKNNPSVFEIKGPFNDTTFLQFIRKQTKDIIGYNYVEFKEKYNLNGDLEDLRGLNNISKKRFNTDNLHKKNEQLKSQLEALKKVKNQLKEYEQKIEQDVKECQNSCNNTFEKQCEKIINIPNPKDMELLVKIKCMEDYLVYLKKAFERGIIKFDDTVSSTRALSRQIFNMNYMRSKFKK
jgi:hypothetical protein